VTRWLWDGTCSGVSLRVGALNVLFLCSFCGKEAQSYHENRLDTTWKFHIKLRSVIAG
jgi:hypothetical protein